MLDNHFNPRSPHGERLSGRGTVYPPAFQSTLPARGATSGDTTMRVSKYISIHAPRTGSDLPVGSLHRVHALISIHAPRTGSDLSQDTSSHAPPLFQSTLPARGATRRVAGYRKVSKYFNPRSPHGERHAAEKCLDGNAEYFNPRSPHGERLDFPAFADSQQPFQSTLPARGATAGAGGRTCATRYFNPRSPHGERQVKARAKRLDEKISIHAPRTGSDGSKATPVLPARGATASTPSCTQRMLYFNPRSPHGERR